MATQPPAEAPQLRQLGVGDIVDRVFALYRSKPLLFIVLGAPPYLVLQVLFIVALGTDPETVRRLSDALLSGQPIDPALMNDAIAVGTREFIVATVGSLILVAIQSAALIDGMSSQYLGRAVVLSQAFLKGLRAAPVIILSGILVFVLVALMWIVLIIASALTQQAIVVAIAFLAATIATVYVLASVLVMPAVVTLEHAGPVAAIRRSWWLSNGNRWRILALEILLGIIELVLSSLLSTIIVGSFISDPATRSGFEVVVNAIAAILWAPIQWGTFTVLYYDLRVRHEAFDLQLAAEALPREA